MWRRTWAMTVLVAAFSLLLFALIGGAQQQWDGLGPADLVEIRGGEDYCYVTNWDSDCEGHPGDCNQVTPSPCEEIGGTGTYRCIQAGEWRLYPGSDNSNWPKCFDVAADGKMDCEPVSFACWQETQCPLSCHENRWTGEQECYFYSQYIRPAEIHNTFQASGNDCSYGGS